MDLPLKVSNIIPGLPRRRLESMKKINIDLDEGLHTKAKVIAFLKNTTLKDYLQKAIEDSVKKDNSLISKMKI
jgi:hypothetical protein